MEVKKISQYERRTTSGVSTSNQHYIVLSLLHEWLKNTALMHAKGDLLDFGCGGRPYQTLFQPNIQRYIAADVADETNEDIDVFLRPDEPVPLPSSSIDTILSTQTLEHVYDVDLYISECRRLLKSDGILIISVPMQWRMHEMPYDYWRFTRFGMVKLLSDNGFVVEKIDPCGGAWALVGQIINSHLDVTGRGNPYIFSMVNRASLWLDRKFHDQDDTLLWMCIARKS